MIWNSVDGRKVVVGAGLAFGNHNNLHFLTGVASIKDPDPEDEITAFTNVKQHIPWIRSIFKNHTGKTIIWYSYFNKNQ